MMPGRPALRLAAPIALIAALCACSAPTEPLAPSTAQSPAEAHTAAHSEAMQRAYAPSEVRVVDGDTLDFAGWDDTLRLHGIDAPEGKRHAHCRAEWKLSALADDYARELLDGATAIIPDLQRTRTGEPDRDRWGRYLGTVELVEDGPDGLQRLDYAQAMIAAGYAQPWDYDGREPKPDWCG